ncbi:hypothetical protein CPHO_09150 [Corynebacterium phocae]|uniref:DUF1206 domain-containing protein n=1 Tax=Corynebacterium phocae TaxID=161895 RepID=A0A1L7D519_9CORY|nr:DUF1206 domain-containing protein [Corynebacterium phocae]APT93022.1 hypothetical protein CPHO_09150 [Corynebacterium phocae]KAA8722511.1 DUF1206 domain-containing protein [Corynebacterium phocae]
MNLYSLADNVSGRLVRLARKATQWSKWLSAKAHEIGPLKWVVRAGFVVAGVVHILIGWLAIASAFGSNDRASQLGALAQISETLAGRALLLVMAACAGVLGVWRVLFSPLEKGWFAKLKMAAKGIAFLYVGWTSATFALGRHLDEDTQATTVTAWVLGVPGGNLLIVVVGLVVVGIGVYSFVKGATGRFMKDLDEHPGAVLKAAAVVGYLARGIAFSVLGGLVIWAAFTENADRASGLDAAFSVIGAQPLGQSLLVILGVGFALYGLYSVARARFTEEVD